MKLCKVKPERDTCLACVDIQCDHGVIEDCKECLASRADYELLYVAVSVFGFPYAIVSKDGKAEKVRLNRIYDIREVTK